MSRHYTLALFLYGVYVGGLLRTLAEYTHAALVAGPYDDHDAIRWGVVRSLFWPFAVVVTIARATTDIVGESFN